MVWQLDAEMAKKKAAADALREQEEFMVVGEGDATCGKCGYEYISSKGDKEFPAPPGTSFMVSNLTGIFLFIFRLSFWTYSSVNIGADQSSNSLKARPTWSSLIHRIPTRAHYQESHTCFQLCSAYVVSLT